MNTVTTSPRLERAGLTAWSLMNSGRRMATKIGSLPFLSGPTRLRKLRQVSESPKRNWISVPWSFSFAVLDPRANTNFEEETLYRAAISVAPSDSRVWKISDSRIFLCISSEYTKWPGIDFSLTSAELFKPVEFGSRFSSGAGAQSFFDGGIGLSVPFLIDCWLSASSEFVGCWLITCSAPMKLSSVLAALMVLASSCCKVSSGFSFVVGGCWCLLIARLVCRRWWGSVIGMPSWLDVVHCRSTYSKFAIKKYEVSLYLWRL